MSFLEDIIKEGTLRESRLTKRKGNIEEWKGIVVYLGNESKVEWAFYVSDNENADVHQHSDEMEGYPWRNTDCVIWVGQ